MPKLTEIIKRDTDKIKEILYTDKLSIVGKTIALKELGRKIAEELYTKNYENIEEFYKDYDQGHDPMEQLEGKGRRIGDLIILEDCPVAGHHDCPIDLFKEDGGFPSEWKAIMDEYKKVFKDDAILHPLCIVHQRIREELAKKIPKGKLKVQSTEVACRSMKDGRIVYSEYGMQLSGKTKEEIDKLIEGSACIYIIG